MTAEKFREILLNRQANPYKRQNLYFAWKKPDDSLFMVGLDSTQRYHILKYEYQGFFHDYGAVYYSIDPHVVHMRGPQRFDPIEELVSKVKEYEYVGCWEDPDILMEANGTGLVLACGRWELAKSHILPPKEKSSLNEKITAAAMRSGGKAAYTNIHERSLQTNER